MVWERVVLTNPGAKATESLGEYLETNAIWIKADDPASNDNGR
tara:strand:+ start:10302 stop:10430 length:129 start_codon:yes stop_codon:yes gene_type:complete